jgi:hypothetical protein
MAVGGEVTGPGDGSRSNKQQPPSMSKDRNTPILVGISTLLLTIWCATSALGGVTLTSIPLAPHEPGSTDTRNEGRAITWDGKWVVGLQGTNSMAYHTNGNAGFLYDVTTGQLRCDIIDSTPSSFCGIMTGVGYRNENGTNEVVITGGNSGNHANWMSYDGGATWGSKRRDTFGSAPTIAVANALGADGTSDVFYSAWLDIPHCYVEKYTGAWTFGPTGAGPAGLPNPPFAKDITSGLKASMNGISASGRVVGYRQNPAPEDTSVRRNWILDWDPVQPKSAVFNGLAGVTDGEAWSVSANGRTIFGHSPTPIDGPVGKWPYKSTFDATVPNPTQLKIDMLPFFLDTTGSTGNAGVPYGCTPDGQYAVGMSYRGMEKAVVWDTSGAATNQWTIMDLTELAKVNGLLGIFDGNLRRAYSVGTNSVGLVITGWGYDNAGAAVRAYVMTVPLPLTPSVTISNSGGGFTLRYVGFGNKTNVLEYTTTLSLPHTWTALDTNTTGSASTYVDVAPADQQRFYRVVSQ